jgi:HAD superfamily phosphoserine phosphatase-like hydrolase
MVTVIIPTLNEQETIGAVIDKIRLCAKVSEIIVVDDKSVDNTVEEARKRNVKIITSPQMGKGSSMRDGLLAAQNEIVAFIDADIPAYNDALIDLITQPIIDDKADFVKSYFERQAGRVTELVAKPLLSILFPDLAKYQQPLSGIIAGKKSFLQQVDFENDYGVDIGLLIDMHNQQARILEVNIGTIENKMKPWRELSKMSREVSKAILKRANSVADANYETLENINIIRTQMEYAIRDSVKQLRKIVVFDMDNTILRGSFLNHAAQAFNFSDKLEDIRDANFAPHIRTKNIAQLFKGISMADILDVVDNIPVVDDFEMVTNVLKKRGYMIGIISDSYHSVTNHIKNKYGLHFSFANELEFSKSVATGEVHIPSFFVKNTISTCHCDVCKSNVLNEISKQFQVPGKNVIAIGDGENDFCLLREAGMGISFCATYKRLDVVADMVIKEPSFEQILEVAD